MCVAVYINTFNISVNYALKIDQHALKKKVVNNCAHPNTTLPFKQKDYGNIALYLALILLCNVVLDCVQDGVVVLKEFDQRPAERIIWIPPNKTTNGQLDPLLDSVIDPRKRVVDLAQ